MYLYCLQASDGWYWKWLAKWKKRNSSSPQPESPANSPTANGVSFEQDINQGLMSSTQGETDNLCKDKGDTPPILASANFRLSPEVNQGNAHQSDLFYQSVVGRQQVSPTLSPAKMVIPITSSTCGLAQYQKMVPKRCSFLKNANEPFESSLGWQVTQYLS